MNNQIKIKVIKKNAPQAHKTPAITTEISNRRAAREMTSTVSGWINESQQLRRAETQKALNLLNAIFAHSRQTGQCSV